jgi:hypothetical protein
MRQIAKPLPSTRAVMRFDKDTAPLAVSATCVGMALPFRAVRDPRFYLKGIYIAPDSQGGAVIVATDGATLAVVYDPDGRAPDGGMILPIGKERAAMLRKRGHVFADSEGRAVITAENGAILWIAPTLKIEGKFPDYTAIIPAASELAPGLIAECNPIYLDRIRRAREACGQRKHAYGVSWWHVVKNPLRSVSVAAYAPNAVAIIMPIQPRCTNSTVDEFLPPSLRTRGKQQEAA